MAKGIVYCLTNPAMPELVKIGLVETDSVDALKKRMANLYTTGVPVPFECYHAVAVENVAKMEKLLHETFSDARENSSREYFRVAPERVVAAMTLTGGEQISLDDDSVTDGSSEEISQADIDARNRLRKQENNKLAAFRFSQADIPLGAELQFVRDSSITARVCADRRIEFEGNETSLSAAAQTVFQRTGGPRGSVAGTLYWEYNSEVLAERRARKMAEAEAESNDSTNG